MASRFALLFFFLSLFAHHTFSQNQKNLQEINKVWAKFYKAFETLDHQPMAEIHSKELLRISGGKRIIDYASYIDNYKTRFEKAKADSISNSITLRFFERINNELVASERGIYKLVRTDKTGIKQSYYGQFHVILRKENGFWKITMDYDSNEGNSINEDSFLNAFAIDDFNSLPKN